MKSLCTVPARVVIGIMLSVYTLSSLMLGTVMNLSIVAMVRHNDTNSSSSHQPDEGEFDWSETTQGLILSAFFWGYLILQLPGGRLAEVIGGRRVMGTALLIPSLLCAIIPPLARQHYGFLVAVRALQGLAMGVRFPALSVIFCRWVPREERARFMSCVLVGPNIGAAILTPLCGLVIARLGWSVLFYLTCAQGLLVTLLWFLLVHDTPAHHPHISPEERTYIESGRVGATSNKDQQLPWRSMISSLQVWLPVLLFVGNDWCTNVLDAFTPKYLSSALNLDIQQNSLFTVLPYVSWSLFGTAIGVAADWSLSRKLVSLLHLRRISVGVSHLLPALVLLLFPVVVSGVAPAVTLLCLRAACNGAVNSGLLLIYFDIAPNYAGTLQGLSSTFGSITGIVAPLIVGAILESDASVSGWNVVFALTAAMYVVTSLPFLCYSSSEVQAWNNHQSPDIPTPYQQESKEDAVPTSSVASAPSQQG